MAGDYNPTVQTTLRRRWLLSATAAVVVCGVVGVVCGKEVACRQRFSGTAAWLVPGAFWFLLLAFLFGLRWRGRLALCAIIAIGYLGSPYVDRRSPEVSAQMRAIATLRHVQESPSERFSDDRFYRYEKSGEWARANARPEARSCGCDNFALSKEGKLYATSDDRPATSSDHPIE